GHGDPTPEFQDLGSVFRSWGLSQASKSRFSCHFIQRAAATIFWREWHPVRATEVKVDLVASKDGSIANLPAMSSRTALRWLNRFAFGLGAVFLTGFRGWGQDSGGESSASS